MVIKDGGRQQMYVCKLVVFNYYTWGKDQCDLKRFRKRMCKPCVSWRGPLYWFKVFNLIIRTQRTSLVLLQEVSNHPPSPHPLTKPNNQTHYSVTWDVNSMLHLHKLGKKYASRLLCSRALCIGSNFAFLYIYIFKRKQCKALVMLEEVSNSPLPTYQNPTVKRVFFMSLGHLLWIPCCVGTNSEKDWQPTSSWRALLLWATSWYGTLVPINKNNKIIKHHKSVPYFIMLYIYIYI